jgi:hypothetical protein
LRGRLQDIAISEKGLLRVILCHTSMVVTPP